MWGHFWIMKRLFIFLDVFGQHRLAQACIVVMVDRVELSLHASEVLLEREDALSSFSVCTPPVQAFISRPLNQKGLHSWPI